MVGRQVTYVVGVGVRVVEPVRPVDDALRLLPEEMVIGSLVNLGDLVTTVDDGLDGPVAVLNVVDLDSGRGDDAKVVASTLHSPPEVGVLVDGLDGTIGKDDTKGHPLVGDDTMVTLEPTVTATKGRAHVADTLASASHYEESAPFVRWKGGRRTSLLASGPEGIGDLLGGGTTTDLDGLAVLSDGDTVELVQVDLDAMVHTSQSGDGSMSSVVSEEGELLLVGVFDLTELLQVHAVPSKRTYRFGNILLSAGDDNNVDRGGTQHRPSSGGLDKVIRTREVNLGRLGQLLPKLSNVLRALSPQAPGERSRGTDRGGRPGGDSRQELKLKPTHCKTRDATGSESISRGSSVGVPAAVWGGVRKTSAAGTKV